MTIRSTIVKLNNFMSSLVDFNGAPSIIIIPKGFGPCTFLVRDVIISKWKYAVFSSVGRACPLFC